MSYQEALEISKRLVKTNLQKYESDLANIQNGIGNLYMDLNQYDNALINSLKISRQNFTQVTQSLHRSEDLCCPTTTPIPPGSPLFLNNNSM